MERQRRTRKSERDEIGKKKEEEERRRDYEDYEPICAALDRVSVDEVYAIVNERGSIKGRML